MPNHERLTFREKCPVIMAQMHFSRYVWSLRFCDEKKVLDAGCGTGYGTSMIFYVASEVMGVDASDEAIDEATTEYGDFFTQCSLETFQGGPYDVIVAFEIIEHVEDMDLVLQRFREMLSPGGKLLLSAPIHQGLNPYHCGRDYSLDQWWDVVQEHFKVLTMWRQPFETPDGSNVFITPFPMGDPVPETGIVLFECE